ncbi:MAG: 5'-3' exonuclease H3TH domain-containing protein [Patescibacteria group bacterium]|jgi:DNA polymerase-1
MKKLLIIDTFNFLHRAYHALPTSLTDKDGNPTNALYGVTSMIISVFELVRPDYIIAALDGKKPTFRVEEFTGYKAHRKPMEDDLSSQIPKVFDILDAFGIKRVLVDGYEADDVIGTVAKEYSHDLEVVIVSNDRDIWQVVGNNVTIMSPSTKRGAPTDWVGEKEVLSKMGFTPNLIPDYKGLRGDPSDNIPGVYGVGDVTAKKLIIEYGTLENIYENLAKVEPESLRTKLAECSEQAVMSKRLAKLILDVPMDIKLEECAYKEFNQMKVRDILERYNFKSLIKRLGFDPDKAKGPEINKDQMALF